jgi:hypothetical protein
MKASKKQLGFVSEGRSKSFTKKETKEKKKTKEKTASGVTSEKLILKWINPYV